MVYRFFTATIGFVTCPPFVLSSDRETVWSISYFLLLVFFTTFYQQKAILIKRWRSHSKIHNDISTNHLQTNSSYKNIRTFPCISPSNPIIAVSCFQSYLFLLMHIGWKRSKLCWLPWTHFPLLGYPTLKG